MTIANRCRPQASHGLNWMQRPEHIATHQKKVNVVVLARSTWMILMIPQSII